MSPANKSPIGMKGWRTFNQPNPQADQSKAVIAQPNTSLSAESVKRPIAPTVYRPSANLQTMQTKMVNALVRKPPATPPVDRSQKKTIQQKAISQLRTSHAAPPVYRPEHKRTAQPKKMGTALAPTLSTAPPVYRPQAKKVNAQTGLPAQLKSKATSSSFSPPGGTHATAIQRRVLAPGPNLANRCVYGRGHGVIQRVQKNLAVGGTVDVEELGQEWVPRMFDDKPVVKVWKRTGTNPVSFNGDTFYSEADERLHPLTADAVNAYWDQKYPGFARSGNPTPLSNCEDYATGGANYRAGTTYNLDNEGERDALRVVLDNGRHVLQLGAVRATAHFLITDKQVANVTIRQKDGDSAIYERSMSAVDAVTYIRSKHSTVIELQRV